MPRVIVGGKTIFLGYLDSSARYLVLEMLRLLGQSFIWDEATDTLVVDRQATGMSSRQSRRSVQRRR